MPQIGWFELLVVVTVAILVIGPKDFPVVLRKLGAWTTRIKKYFTDVQLNINTVTNFDDNIDKNFTSKKKKVDDKEQ